MTELQRHCPRCKTDRPISDYKKNRKPCRLCRNAVQRAWIASSPSVTQRMTAASRKWRHSHPEQYRAMRNRYYASRKEAIQAQRRARRKSDPQAKQRQLDWQRQRRCQKKFGIPRSAYDAMLQEQGGVCFICKEPPSSRKELSVDHSHATGAVRGLLCMRCNWGVGQFHDDPVLLRTAATYLERHAPMLRLEA